MRRPPARRSAGSPNGPNGSDQDVDLNTVEAIVPADRAALDGWAAGDSWLAGGTWLFSQGQPQLRRLLDLSAFGWPAIVEGPDGVEGAATCTLAEFVRWAEHASWPAAPLVRQCCEALLASFK